MGWGNFSNWGGGRSAGAGKGACQSRSYHDGGVRDDGLNSWYSDRLANHYGGRGGRKHWQQDDDDHGSGTGGSGTGGSGTGGSGKGGSGSGGSGTGGSSTGGSGGGKGRWGKKKWWQERDEDHSGSGSGGSGTGGSGTGGSGTGGSGTGGSGKGSGGTGGSGTGGSGTGGSGTGGSGTGGSGTGGSGTDGSGTGGSGTGGGGGDTGGGADKASVSFEIGGNGDPSVTVEVTQTPEGQLFIKLAPTSYDGEVADVDGLFFNMTDDADVPGLNFFPDENALPVTGHAAQANAVNTLDDGSTVPENFDGMVQFGQSPDSTDGTVNNANFTLWSDTGLTLDDIDLSSMSLVVTNPDGSQQVLNGGYDPAAAASNSTSYANGGVSDEGLDTWYAANMAQSPGTPDDGEPSAEDVMALMNQPVEEQDDPGADQSEDNEMDHYI
ncbi:hypothetical protein [Pseudophaeobacter sp.]|uniref:hypothetical protein n=1 Tax=Pseudophaeobacter sp. TaxID=1971739 RepID=UPI00329A4AFE